MKRAGIIAKAAARPRRRRREPLEVILTFRMNLGERPSDAMTLIHERRVPLVGSVFDNRDRILREFVRLLLKAGARQPRAVRKLLALRKGRP